MFIVKDTIIKTIELRRSGMCCRVVMPIVDVEFGSASRTNMSSQTETGLELFVVASADWQRPPAGVVPVTYQQRRRL